MKAFATLLLALALGGCAAAPLASDVDRLFADHLFAAPSQPVRAQDVFAVSEEMRGYLGRELGEGAGPKGRQQALVDALRARDQLRLEYDGAFTRNAREAFAARTGNCLSLVIMTAALAREINVPVRFQNVVVDESWTRRGDLYFSAGHVNLTLGANPPRLGTRIDDGEQLTIDFLPPRDLRGTRWAPIEERTILAMFMNNRAAESLAAGSLDDAYWFAREAIFRDPAYSSSYNTLGVIYHRGGHLEEAARAFRLVLAREPSNTHVLSNLVPVLAAMGRVEESREMELRLARLEPDPPFVFFNRGQAAMRAGSYREARDLFAQEVARDPYNHEFHFWLALAHARLGEEDLARRHLALALDNSTTRQDHDAYAAKLRRIKSASLH